jgi:hypothetical protein
LGIKSLDFQDFNKVVKLMSSGAHLTSSGLAKIQSIKAGINSNRNFVVNCNAPDDVASNSSDQFS